MNTHFIPTPGVNDITVIILFLAGIIVMVVIMRIIYKIKKEENKIYQIKETKE